MTKALQELLAEVQHLEPALQDELVSRIGDLIKELEEEQEWEALVRTPASQVVLSKLKARAQEQIAKGDVHDLDDIS